MAIFSRIIFEAVKWRARRGLNADADSLSDVKQDGRQRGVRGETFGRRFLMERHVKDCPVRFDVVAIEEFPGQAPVVRSHKKAFHPRM
jgi:hypothetical protein